ncbi:MAG: type I phosphomannose isomerase catalytic subunit [Chloroflexota bacterium]|nr:type I phosphomannose isomerase catalytic subunit [Chloroflexota bacterium]
MHPFRIQPDLRPRVWGGTRLTPAGAAPIGEAWLAGPSSQVVGGAAPGATLDELAALHGARLTGGDASTADRFPLLAKILDPAHWVSVQVHPNDEQARRLEGPDAVGKTEAWYVIEAAPDAEVLLGARPSVRPEAVRQALRDGGLTGLLRRFRVAAGEAYLVPAGTLHAIGPGVLAYEIQQPSDITYRCDDWGRPPSAGRPLHIEQALACLRPTPWTERIRSSAGSDPRGLLIDCEHFVVEYLRLGRDGAVPCDLGMASVHVLTAVTGSAVVRGAGWEERLDRFETLVVPADAGSYQVVVPGDALRSAPAPVVLLARLPAPGERGRADREVGHVDPA